MKTSKLLLSSMLFIALISACSTEQEKKKVEFIKIDTIEKNKKNENLNIHLSPIDTFYNNLTQLLGGKDTVFSFSNNWDIEFIKKYARKVNEKYKKIETNRLKKMGDWNQKNLKRNNQSDTSFVFYPFSGGDFIHLSWMFPNATQYLMVAQEDVGNIPDLYNQDSKFVNKYLSEIDTVLRDIYYKSYFITKNIGLKIYNVGTGIDTTVLELVNSFEKVNNTKINYKFSERRKGDLESSYSNVDLIKKESPGFE